MTLRTQLMNGSHLNRRFGVPKKPTNGRVTLTQEEMASCLLDSEDATWKALKGLLLTKGVPQLNLTSMTRIHHTENEDGSVTLVFNGNS